jgi:predicted Zn-dependent peptidase
MKFLAILLFLQGFLMSAVLEHIEINKQKVPVIFEESRHLPIVNMQIVFQNAGSIKDSVKGLAKLTAKILNEGTKTLGSVGFANKLDSKAISISASAGVETITFEISSLKSEFNEAISLLIELLSEPNITQNSFDRVKTMTKGSLLNKESDFDYIATINLNRAIFKDTFLQEPMIGSSESLDKITLKDIENFIADNITLDRVIAVIGGDLNITEANDELSKILKILPTKPSSNEIYKLDAKDSNETIKIIKPETKQAYIYFGSPLYIEPKSEENYKAKVASFILGASGFGSRMMEEIRVKRGLAYSVYSRFSINKSSTHFTGHLQTKLESQDEAINVVKELISEFVKNGVTQKELDSAKKFLLGSEPLRNEILSQRLSKTFMEYYKGLEIGYSTKELELIEALTLDSLNEFIKSHKEINNLTFSIVTNK